MLQSEFEKLLRKYLDPKMVYTSREIAFILDTWCDRFDIISMGWKAVYHKVVKVKVIQVKDKGLVHWHLLPPRKRKKP